MKTSMSRFQIHDELTAPEGSVPVLRGALATGGQLPNFLGVLAGSPAALRAYARFRSELRHGTLTLPTLERIALAVADHYDSEPGIEEDGDDRARPPTPDELHSLVVVGTAGGRLVGALLAAGSAGFADRCPSREAHGLLAYRRRSSTVMPPAAAASPPRSRQPGPPRRRSPSR